MPKGLHNSRQGIHTLEVQHASTAAYTHSGLACNNSERADVDDLEGGGELFDTGQICHLPLVPLEGKQCLVTIFAAHRASGNADPSKYKKTLLC